MKLKIINIKKFVRSLILIIIGVILLLFITLNNTYSNGEIRYKDEYITYGDTIWEIAKKECKENKYFENKDVRSIVKEIKSINNIENQTLQVGEKILIPTY